uniref:GRF-type domain-containing protein n=1 Tax=Kalanchoe fedtschenkoi TaxID=63787 RepID=A0A7N0T6M5_KALFE
MTTLERKESMQGHYEATKSLHGKGYPCNLQHYKSIAKERKDAARAYKTREPVKANGPSIEFQKPSTEIYKKPTHNPGYCSRPLSVTSGYQKVQALPVNSFEGQFYPYVDNWFGGVPAIPFDMFGYAYPYEAQFQEFQYFVVIDFEATCDKDRIPHPQEIIEFPSVIVNSMTGQLQAHFQTYVRPTCNKHLTDFCKDLTGIQQTQVDKGVTLSEALFMHDEWLDRHGIKDSKFAVVTWSNWDCQVMLESECRFKKILKPAYFNQWINLKVPFHQVYGSQRCNLRGAVELAGLVWQGRAHCGLDDAKNTARLLAYFMQIGFKFAITNSLTWEGPEKLSPDKVYSPPNYYTPPCEFQRYCFCGAKSRMGLTIKPGQKQNSYFFGCGNWSNTRGSLCQYFEWASPSP